MVQNIEKFCPELSLDALAEVEILGHRKIKVAESRIWKQVAVHGPKRSQRWRKHDRIALRVAAKKIQRRGSCL